MSNRYEATGVIRAIMKTQDISDSFKKREFALEIADGNFTQTVKFQTVQDKTELLDDLEIGQEVTVHFNLKGREFTRKSDGTADYWVNLECWRIEASEKSSGQQVQKGKASKQESARNPDFPDIPF